jgi:hypothetical protein
LTVRMGCGVGFNAHNRPVNTLAGLSLTDLEPIDKRRPPHMTRGVDLDADPLAVTDEMKIK